MENETKVINLALPIGINSFFIYTLPEGISIENVIGKRVLVNFNGRLIRGIAVSKGKYTSKFKIKPILKIIDDRIVIKEKLVKFAEWIADYYFAGIGEVLSLMVPKGIKPAPDDNLPEKAPRINELSTTQKNVYEKIKSDIAKGQKRFYLYGVTGSGKTEVYVKLIEDTINKGKSVIFLVPEIALSYQTLGRLQERFGSLCAVLHSNLKGSVRLREYFKLFDGKAKIAIGPRSALFAPLDDVGLIIIDEENEGAYKSEESPRFHARTAALFLQGLHDCLLIMGSATPSIESWYHAKNGYFKLYTLLERFGGALLPEITIIDNSAFLTKKNLSLPLTNEINERLQKKEQVVLLQNRRGFANFIKCKTCGNIISCPKCEISLTYHKIKNNLICHHCGYHIDLPEKCPKCQDEKLLKIGAGTERIEDEISATFKFAKIKRMDYDSLKNVQDMTSLFNEIENGNINILVGTQMIAKGLHFPKIKLVGIINADLILNIPDYKASERTFSLITQVAGRAGRVGEKGLVMIQTMNPDHYTIIAAKNNSYEEFYTKEIEHRSILGMPPFMRLLRLVIRGRDEEKIKEDINKLSKNILKESNKNIQIFGPAPCLFFKINNNYRYQILLKSKKISILQEMVKKTLPDFNINSKNHLEIDVDPSGLL